MAEDIVDCNARRVPEQPLDLDRIQWRPPAPKMMRRNI
jgi:hypothetical protein